MVLDGLQQEHARQSGHRRDKDVCPGGDFLVAVGKDILIEEERVEWPLEEGGRGKSLK